MHRHIIYIINPISGTRTRKDIQQFIEKKTRDRGIPYHVFPSVESGDYSFLRSVIEEHQTTDIVIAGGDGTISHVVDDLINFDVNFGIIPCGSGNGLAYTAKIGKQPDKALDIVFDGKASSVDGFYINDRFACMLCGLGFDAKVAHDFAQQPKRGLTTYITQIIKNFFSAANYHFEIQLSGRTFSTEAFFISIANSNQFGNNFTIAPQASLSDGLLDIVIVTQQQKMALLWETFKQVSGYNPLVKKESVGTSGNLEIDKKGIVYFQTDKLTILNPSEAPLHIDGDPAETATRFDIKIKKKCFRLIQPASS
ncbi:MAG: YegS/Rv2252/BmrU family lipid kinase [Chitinophagaceae bacterium]|nr:YegS/Rv2252/BmrU family lipid kinase [Chitinophagaceae bacterium]